MTSSVLSVDLSFTTIQDAVSHVMASISTHTDLSSPHHYCLSLIDEVVLLLEPRGVADGRVLCVHALSDIVQLIDKAKKQLKTTHKQSINSNNSKHCVSRIAGTWPPCFCCGVPKGWFPHVSKWLMHSCACSNQWKIMKQPVRHMGTTETTWVIDSLVSQPLAITGPVMRRGWPTRVTLLLWPTKQYPMHINQLIARPPIRTTLCIYELEVALHSSPRGVLLCVFRCSNDPLFTWSSFHDVTVSP